MKLRNGFLVSFCILLNSCKGMQYETHETSLDSHENSMLTLHGAYPDREPVHYIQYEKACTEDLAVKDIGFARINIEGKNKQENLKFDFSGVSGIGLVNKVGLGVVQDYVWEGVYEKCQALDVQKSAFTCEKVHERINKGKPILFCKIPSEGYPIDSIENAALVATSAYLTTMRMYGLVSNKLPPRDIGFLMFPTFRRIFHMQDGTTEVRYDVDNARWTNRHREGGWNFTIDLLPTSKWRLQEYAKVRVQLKEYWLQPGVISHEVGHNIFAYRAAKLKQFGYKLNTVSGTVEPTQISFADPIGLDRSVGMQMNVSALDEGFADMISHLSYNSSTSPNYGFQLDRTLEARRVRASRVSEKGQEKALTEPVLRHFYSRKRKFPPQNSYVPDHQDEHAIGAIIANSLDLLFGMKFNETSEHHETLNKYKLVNATIDRIQELYLSNKDSYSTMPSGGYSSKKGSGENYETGPAMFLQDAMWELTKQAFVGVDTLTHEQCKILQDKFPVYVVDWKGKYHCH